MKSVFAILFLTLLSVTTFAQGKISGSVKKTDGEAVPFANVTLYFAADSTKLFGGSITDFGGNYAIKDIKPGVYFLAVSSIGVKTIREKISVSDTSRIIKNFVVEEDMAELSEIEIKDYRTKNFTDHKEFTFSKQQVEKAFDAKDLMRNVNGIKIDPVSGDLKSNKSGDIKILINGISATETDLKQLSADKIAKVEYYTIPPARYADAGSVLNVVTKELTNGISGGIDLTHALAAGFADDEIYFNAVKGNSRFSLSYLLSWRDFNDRIGDVNYDYKIGDQDWRYYKKLHDNFGYTENEPVVKYTYSKPKKTTFQATFKPNYYTSFSNAKSDVIFDRGSSRILGTSISKSDEKTFGPSLDLYLSKNISDKQELSLDFVGTYYDLTQKEKENGTDIADNSSIIADDMNLANKKKSLIGELAYKFNFAEDFSFSAGYKGTFARSDFKISNILSDYKTYGYSSYNENDYFYGELSGSAGDAFSYRVSAGGTFVKNENDDEKYKKWIFTPQVVLNYDISETQNLSLMFKSQSKVPSISKLSNNAELLIPKVLQMGNPKLETSNLYELYLEYTFSSDKIDLDFQTCYAHEHNSFSSYYTLGKYKEEDYLISINQNAKYFRMYGLYYDISYYPFENVDLTLNVYGYLVRHELESDIIGSHSILYSPFYYYIEYSAGGFEISYEGNIPSKMLYGSSITANENQSDLCLSYKFSNNIKLSAQCYWLFTKAKYESETLPSSLLSYKSDTHIDDCKSMLVLGFAWNFSRGKSISVKQKLQNKDTDKGTF